jgi:hypothetical protein
VQDVDAGQEAQPEELATPEDDLRSLEEDLRDGKTENVSRDLGLPGAHQGKRRILMASGRVCIAKPARGIQDWPFAAQSEAAAWTMARWLGLRELVPVTVLREIELPEGRTEPAALQLWVDDYDADRMDDFPEEDLDAAGLFDYLIQQTDRDGHNWLVWRDGHGRPRLRLTDNGYAFGAPGRSFSSQFSRDRSGRPLSDRMLAALRRLKEPQFAEELKELLPHEQVEALLGRVDTLLDQQQLP